MPLSYEAAEQIAQKELHFEIGSLPYLKYAGYDEREEVHTFAILYTYTDIQQNAENIYYNPALIGVIEIHGTDTITRTPDEELGDAITRVKENAHEGSWSQIIPVE